MSEMIRSTVVIYGREERLYEFWKNATRSGIFDFENIIPAGNDVGARLKRWGVITTPSDVAYSLDGNILEITWYTIQTPVDELWCAVSAEYDFTVLTEFGDDPEDQGFFWIKNGERLSINQPR
jgi:hypothetical protein